MPAVTASLAGIVASTPRSRLLTVALGGQPFPFAAGQAVMFGPHGSTDRKPYSIASSPGRVAETGQLELLIAVDGSDLSWATPGAAVDVEGPLGTFAFPDAVEAARLFFVAGGTGIAPLRAMIDHALVRHPQLPLSLLYSARRSDEFAFIDELRTHERNGKLELSQTVTRDDSTTWQGRRGRIDRTEFERMLPDPATTLCFVCGPPQMVVETVVALSALAVPASAIRTEQWGK